jgi:hypothetical protein
MGIFGQDTPFWRAMATSQPCPPYERLLHYIFFASFVARSIDLNLIDLDNTRQIAEVHPSYRGEYNVSIDIVRFVV